MVKYIFRFIQANKCTAFCMRETLTINRLIKTVDLKCPAQCIQKVFTSNT